MLLIADARYPLLATLEMDCSMLERMAT